MPETRDNPAQTEHKFVRRLRRFGNQLLSVGSMLSCALMLCLFAVGFWLMFTAIWGNRGAWLGHGEPAVAGVANVASSTRPHPMAVSDSRQIMVDVLHGLEFLFLAPLPALVFLSLASFFRSFQSSGGGNGGGAGRADETLSVHQLHRVKALVVSLMIASVATDLLGKALGAISMEVAAAESLVMLLLGVYWFLLERVSSAGHPIDKAFGNSSVASGDR